MEFRSITQLRWVGVFPVQRKNGNGLHDLRVPHYITSSVELSPHVFAHSLFKQGCSQSENGMGRLLLTSSSTDPQASQSNLFDFYALCIQLSTDFPQRWSSQSVFQTNMAGALLRNSCLIFLEVWIPERLTYKWENRRMNVPGPFKHVQALMKTPCVELMKPVTTPAYIYLCMWG